ncbi:MAG: cofactor-independent phosphoglycerate mutase, partial [Candidatus Omnitrophica bacterium]|nr:cofactor-independent phosphoglycerate mutase [Candidatus Omnitrophota bacterium]
MKYVVIVPDGAADYPLEQLNGKTPFEVADMPNLDKLMRSGVVGRVRTVPRGYPASSDVANLSLLGYNPKQYYSGRAPMEAANLGIELGDDDLAIRCNLVTEAQDKLLDYSAGHITTKEADILIKYLDDKLGTDDIRFYTGKSYRHLLVIRNAGKFKLDKLKCFAPHDIMGGLINKYLPKGDKTKILETLMMKSRELLSTHEVNKVRVDLGESPANMVWFWGAGHKPRMPLFKNKYGINGSVVSAVDLINGLGKIIGLDVLDVKGATGYYDTNYRGKAEAALNSLKENDFTFIHVEATDEAGHNQDLRMKIICLERIDKLIIGPVMERLAGVEHKIMVVPDHPTPVDLR